MAASGTHEVPIKPRDELDVLLDGFERDLTVRIDALIDYGNGYANSILSVTGADDDPYVSSRINAILRHCSLTFNLPDPEPSAESSSESSARKQ